MSQFHKPDGFLGGLAALGQNIQCHCIDVLQRLAFLGLLASCHRSTAFDLNELRHA